MEYGEVRLMIDPRVEGDVFNTSWSLLSPTSQNAFERESHRTGFWRNMGDAFQHQIVPIGKLDSYCVLKVNDITILNLNDCYVVGVPQPQ